MNINKFRMLGILMASTFMLSTQIFAANRTYIQGDAGINWTFNADEKKFVASYGNGAYEVFGNYFVYSPRYPHLLKLKVSMVLGTPNLYLGRFPNVLRKDQEQWVLEVPHLGIFVLRDSDFDLAVSQGTRAQFMPERSIPPGDNELDASSVGRFNLVPFVRSVPQPDLNIRAYSKVRMTYDGVVSDQAKVFVSEFGMEDPEAGWCGMPDIVDHIDILASDRAHGTIKQVLSNWREFDSFQALAAGGFLAQKGWGQSSSRAFAFPETESVLPHILDKLFYTGVILTPTGTAEPITISPHTFMSWAVNLQTGRLKKPSLFNEITPPKLKEGLRGVIGGEVTMANDRYPYRGMVMELPSGDIAMFLIVQNGSSDPYNVFLVSHSN